MGLTDQTQDTHRSVAVRGRFFNRCLLNPTLFEARSRYVIIVALSREPHNSSGVWAEIHRVGIASWRRAIGTKFDKPQTPLNRILRRAT